MTRTMPGMPCWSRPSTTMNSLPSAKPWACAHASRSRLTWIDRAGQVICRHSHCTRMFHACQLADHRARKNRSQMTAQETAQQTAPVAAPARAAQMEAANAFEAYGAAQPAHRVVAGAGLGAGPGATAPG